MTVTEIPVEQLAVLEAKIDRLTDQVAILTADADQRARQREALQDFTGDFARVSEDAMGLAIRELESLSRSADLSDTLRLLRRLAEVAPALDRALVWLSQLAEFAEDAAPLGTDVMSLITDRLAIAEERGYFEFAGAAIGVADRVVTNFDEDDLDQLGDNVVTILETVREITQPEMLTLLGRMVDAVRAEQALIEDEPAEPPSLFALARQVRDPDVRRGMARALHTLRAVSVETGPHTSSPTTSLKGDNQ